MQFAIANCKPKPKVSQRVLSSWRKRTSTFLIKFGEGETWGIVPFVANSRSRKDEGDRFFSQLVSTSFHPTTTMTFEVDRAYRGKDWPRSRSKAEGSTGLDNFSPVESLPSARNSHEGGKTIKETEV